MKSKILLSFIAVFFFQSVYCQLFYDRVDSIQISANGQVLKSPFIGGFNAPQFNEIDLNFDGKLDLIVLDRSGLRLSPFINVGTTGQIAYDYAPAYASSFPSMRDWMITADYNCDGKMDLFIGSSTISLFENISSNGNLQFQFVSKISSDYGSIVAQVNPGRINKPAIVDMNNDGDLDLLFFDQNGSQMEFHKNLSKEFNSICGLNFELRSRCWGNFTESGFDGNVYLDSCRFGDIANPESKGAKHAGSTVSAFDLDGSGSMDLLVGDIDGKNLTALYNNDSVIPYLNSFVNQKDTLFPSYNTPIELPIFPAAYFVDINNDNQKDILVSSNSNSYGSFTRAKNNILYYENKTANPQFNFQAGSNLFYEDMIDLGKGNYPSFFDYDNDGLMDLLVGNEGYLNPTLNGLQGQLALFVNNGSLQSPSFQLIDTNFLDLPSIPLNVDNNVPTTHVQPTFSDLDGDGDADLLIGDFQGHVHYYEDTSSTGNNAAFELKQPVFQGIDEQSLASPYLFDVDKDGLSDLIIGDGSGKMSFYKNLGTSSEAVFTLDVQSILWQNGNTIRYQLNGNPDLSQLSIGQKLDINNSNNQNNGIFQTIVAIDNNQKYLDLNHPFRTSSLDDEPTTNAIIDYSDKDWGNINLTRHRANRDASPLLYLEQNELRLLVGSRNGYVYYYDSLENNLKGSFNLVDSNYLHTKIGESSRLAGADLNQDGMLDLFVGNEAGGFNYFMARGYVGLEEEFNMKKGNWFSVYPNPAKDAVQVVVNDEQGENARLEAKNIQGQVLFSKPIKDRLSIDVSDWAAGIYFISILNDAGIKTQKLIISQ